MLHSQPSPAAVVTSDQLAYAWGKWVRDSMGSVSGVGRSARKHDQLPQISFVMLTAFGVAYAAQPDGIDKEVFKAQFLRGADNIKCEAARLGISRQHYYRLLASFLERTYSAAVQIACNIGGGIQ